MMDFKQITSIYFSPTESTGGVVKLIAAQFGGSQVQLDLTDANRNRPEYCFLENELVVVGAPVYGGRIPAVAAERLRLLHGHHTPVVLIVVYGNRAYEDALVELSDIMVEQGFVPSASAAVVAEHNIVRSIAAGRPDINDRDKLEMFGRQAAKKLRNSLSAGQLSEPAVPGNHPYKEYHGVPMKINVTSGCTNCGTCIRKCPVQAISRTDPKITDKESCIACMRCVRVCPVGGRNVSRLLLLALKQMLKKACAGRKEPEFFL